MKRAFLFFATLIISFNSHSIVNGERAIPEQFPFFVSIYDNGNNFICGGSILNDKHILTAGHCVLDSPNDYRVLIYQNDDSDYDYKNYKQIKNIIFPDNYNNNLSAFGKMSNFFNPFIQDGMYNDYAVLELVVPIMDNVSSIEILTDHKIKSDLRYFAIGRGKVENHLEDEYSNSHLLNTSKNKQKFLKFAELDNFKGMNLDGTYSFYKLEKDRNGFKGVAQGDSGSPLIVYDESKKMYFQVGVASYSSIYYNKVDAVSSFTNVTTQKEFLKPFIDGGKKLVYNPNLGMNDYKSVGDGLTNEQAMDIFLKDANKSKNNQEKIFYFMIAFFVAVFTYLIGIFAITELKHSKFLKELEKEDLDMGLQKEDKIKNLSVYNKENSFCNLEFENGKMHFRLTEHKKEQRSSARSKMERNMEETLRKEKLRFEWKNANSKLSMARMEKLYNKDNKNDVIDRDEVIRMREIELDKIEKKLSIGQLGQLRYSF